MAQSVITCGFSFNTGATSAAYLLAEAEESGFPPALGTW